VTPDEKPYFAASAWEHARHRVVWLLILMLSAAITGSIITRYEDAISAVSLVDTVNVLLVNAFSALATGGAVIAGQYLGRREPKKAGHSGQQLLLFMGEASLLIMLLFYLGKGFVLHVVFGQVEPDVAAYANTYYMIVEASTPFLAIYSAGAALFRVMGNSKISMWVSLAMNAINVAGNALLIFGLHMGVEGVAIPTLVSRAAAAAAMVVLLKRPGLPMRVEKFTLRHDRYVVKNILRFGVPNGLESSMFQLGKILLLSTVSVLGTASVAANAIGNTISNFNCFAGQAINLGLAAVVSQCVGAGEFDQARAYLRKIVKWTYGIMAVVNLTIIALLPLIMRVYNVSPEAEKLAVTVTLIHGISSIFIWVPAFMVPGFLRAAGDAKFTMLASMLTMWVVRVMLAYVLGKYMGYGVIGVWFAHAIVDWSVRSVIFFLRYRSGKWETMGIKT